MFTLPFPLPDPDLSARLVEALDVEGKIPRALQELGPIAGRRVAVVGDGADALVERIQAIGGEVVGCVTAAGLGDLAPAGAEVAVVVDDVLSTVSPDAEARLATIERLLCRPGRLLVMLHYGRDDVARLADVAEGAGAADAPDDEDEAPGGAPADYAALRQRDRWFLGRGFKMRVIHGWWTFGALEQAADFLAAAFGPAGGAVASGMRRPRLSYKVVIYHRSLVPQDGADATPCDPSTAAGNPPAAPAHGDRDRA